VSDDRRRHRRAGVTLPALAAACAALAVCLTCTSGAWAAAPSNDAFDGATTISELPFSSVVSTSDATIETDEPQFCWGTDRSVWYAITPAHDGKLAADTAGTAGSSQVAVYRQDGAGLGGLSYVDCQNFFTSKVVFDVHAGTTYYLQASTLFGSTDALHLNVDEAHPPANDDFEHATAIGSLPFDGSVDLSAATVQQDEPVNCQGIVSQQTAWYAFTPSETGSYQTQMFGGAQATVYTGNSPSSLTAVACGSYLTRFHADAGTTYHLQISTYGFSGGLAQFTLSPAPPAVASFYYYPSDPSLFDTVQFVDWSWDWAGIASRSWQLGDGLPTSTDCCPSHRYASDGSYPARLDITTTDGRSASSTQTVAVKTHDVAITGLTVPAKGRVGRTKPISVAVNNSRYPETVQVSILRSIPGAGFEQVGQVIQGVPARAARRKTSFDISYTFSPEDATFGKVTFEAVASILSARDANPNDNTVIAPATKVTG
jgi:PKD repeat protein